MLAKGACCSKGDTYSILFGSLCYNFESMGVKEAPWHLIEREETKHVALKSICHIFKSELLQVWKKAVYNRIAILWCDFCVNLDEFILVTPSKVVKQWWLLLHRLCNSEGSALNVIGIFRGFVSCNLEILEPSYVSSHLAADLAVFWSGMLHIELTAAENESQPSFHCEMTATHSLFCHFVIQNLMPKTF